MSVLWVKHLYLHASISSSQHRMDASVPGQAVQPACLCSHDRSCENLCSCTIVGILDCASRKCLAPGSSLPGSLLFTCAHSIWRSCRAAAPIASPPRTHCKPFISGRIYCVEKSLTCCLISAVLRSRSTMLVSESINLDRESGWGPADRAVSGGRCEKGQLGVA